MAPRGVLAVLPTRAAHCHEGGDQDEHDVHSPVDDGRGLELTPFDGEPGRQGGHAEGEVAGDVQGGEDLPSPLRRCGLGERTDSGARRRPEPEPGGGGPGQVEREHVQQQRCDRDEDAGRTLDLAAGPPIAVRLSVVTRRTLGGLQTDLVGSVLAEDGTPVPGLWAAGEVAGFGGGVHGYRSPEGTSLRGRPSSGRRAGHAVTAARRA